MDVGALQSDPLKVGAALDLIALQSGQLKFGAGTGLDLNPNLLCKENGFGSDSRPLQTVCGPSEPKGGLNVLVGDNRAYMGVCLHGKDTNGNRPMLKEGFLNRTKKCGSRII